MIEKRHRRGGLTRRALLRLAGGVLLASAAPAASAAERIKRRPIPATGERIPVLGMGTWITFNVGRSKRLRDQRCEVLRTFFELGGGMIDSSPMYGSSEEVVGDCLGRLASQPDLFSATKVWTHGRSQGIRQMEESQRLWGGGRFDLMQIHNLRDWESHLETLIEWKASGRLRYIGITTSHGLRHREFERLMKTVPLDFVQFSYNVLDREAERALLPLAAERGLGVIVNRPFQTGRLFDAIAARAPLPDFALEFDCRSWAQFFLKFLIAHPAVTCVIPATSRSDHMRENMQAGYGRLPDEPLRQRMRRYVDAI